MIVRGVTQKDGEEEPFVEIVVEAADYFAGKAEVLRRLPEGWTLIHHRKE